MPVRLAAPPGVGHLPVKSSARLRIDGNVIIKTEIPLPWDIRAAMAEIGDIVKSYCLNRDRDVESDAADGSGRYPTSIGSFRLTHDRCYLAILSLFID